MNNIREILDNGLCTACGACSGICRHGAIRIEENLAGFRYAKLDESKCVSCGLCTKLCPSNPENKKIDDLNQFLHGKCLRGAIGHATDKWIWREGQTGGLVTAILTYLLETDKIDAALVTSFDPEKRRPYVLYADTYEKIVSGTGSYYAQTSVVEEVLKHQDRRLAVVALGCQARALDTYRKMTRKNFPEYIIGLICISQNSAHMIDDFLNLSGYKLHEKIVKFRFKYSHPAYGGWPGNVFIQSERRKETIPSAQRHNLKLLHESYRCLLCGEQMNEYADIVCGDPWGIPKRHPVGETVVVARTERGGKLLEEASKAGYIHTEDMPVDIIFKGQTVDNRERKKVLAGKQFCQKHGYMWPYTLNETAEKVDIKIRKDYERRLKYTKKLLGAESESELNVLYEKRKKELKRKTFTNKIKRTVYFPIRCMRYVSRRLRQSQIKN